MKCFDERQAQLFEVGVNEYYADKPIYKTAFTILLPTGMSISELLGLKWHNVDYDNFLLTLDGHITHLGDGTRKYETGLKNEEGFRVIEIDKTTHNKLKEWQHVQRLESLRIGKPIQSDDFIVPYARTTITNRFYRFQDGFNKTHSEQLPRLNIHGLRDNNVSLLISDWADLKKWRIA